MAYLEVRHERNRSFQLAIALSVLVHLFWVAFLFYSKKIELFKVAETPKEELIWVDLTPKPAEEKRIVQTNVGRKSDTAAPDAFLGKETRVVDQDRQTVSKQSSDDVQVPAREKTAPTQQKSKVFAEKTPHAVPLAKLGVPMIRDVTEDEKKDLSSHDEFEKKYEQISGDYVKGLKESENTALNTKEYVYFGYFQRIRAALDQAWKPILKAKLIKIYRSGRSLANEMDYITKTLVTLNKEGRVVRVQVVEESGKHDLDETAVKAFNEAGPFPNPPNGIIDRDGFIQVRWDFILRT